MRMQHRIDTSEAARYPLKYFGGNVWSRRINEADRLVYEVFDDRVEFLQARYHYG